jgi:hypothetical protein
MAFRLRWHRRGGFRQTSAKPAIWWAFTMAYAGTPEDEALLQGATGWRFEGPSYHYPNNARPLEQLPRLREFVDKGIPVVGCFPEEFGVLHGYDDETNEVLVTAYQKPGEAFWMPIEEVGTKLIYLVSRQPAAPRALSISRALREGASNWVRGEIPASEAGSQWEEPQIKIQYGAAAYREWAHDLLHADLVAERARQQLRTASAFNMTSLADARRAAAAYLRQSESLLPRSCQPSLTAAAEIYEALSTEISELRTPHEEFFGVWYGEDLSSWTAGRRESEAGLLERFAEMDAAAMRELQVVIRELPAPDS